ncbi:MAG: UvrD-helicase domain-containing protein [Caulobacter sp.]|nr:UvrD-helicase domain-containing protein [Caulobacter sp.]
MKYIAVQREAVEELIANRLTQSADYEPGRILADVLKGRSRDISKASPRLEISDTSPRGGLIVYRPGAESRTFIVFDLDESTIFSPNRDDGDVVLYFQRTMRFAVKYWEQRVMNSGENVYPQYQRAIIFPHPISQKTNFRISIDLNPDDQRLGKRGKTERYILVYRAGTSDGDGPKEKPSWTAFRKFLEDLRSVNLLAARPKVADSAENIDAFQNVSLPVPQGRMDIHQGFDVWTGALTDPQRRFVEGAFESPIRIEGPAGTGKTLCLAMKSIFQMRKAETEDAELSAIFVTHSEATRRSIEVVLESMGAARFLNSDTPRRALKVETLQGLSAGILRQDLAATEFVDPDAYDAKQMQILYVDEALSKAEAEINSYERFFSPAFSEFYRTSDRWEFVQMLQHEIAVVIKGRASEDFESYKRIPTIPQGIPLIRDADRAFVWNVYKNYREQLVDGGQFDTDDVVLSALSQLTTPIWRRRRPREGYDQIFIDETHLFNMNELSVFHHLTKDPVVNRIAFAVDRSQAIGDRGWVSDIDVTGIVHDGSGDDKKVNVREVFRCSPDIVNLAFAVTSSGASLFTNFENPLAISNSGLSFEEERNCAPPVYIFYNDDKSLVYGCLARAEAIAKETKGSRGDIVIIAFDDELFKSLCDLVIGENKPLEILKERGDVEIVNRARQSGRFVLTMPDYVGGLEFDAAILVGVDKGRVPASGERTNGDSRSFLNYVAHNRLYVAITRARYRVEILGVRSHGPSPILLSAMANGALTEISEG